MTVRTLSPIADVLADPQYTSRVASCFRSTDRVSFMRFGSDTYSTVIEMLNLTLADVVAGRVKFYPKDEIRKTGREPETGPVAQQVANRWTLCMDGRTVESFADAQRLEWHSSIRASRRKMLKAACMIELTPEDIKNGWSLEAKRAYHAEREAAAAVNAHFRAALSAATS